jgi:penicillin amidase
MAAPLAPDELRAAVPVLAGPLSLKGLERAVEVYRDGLGIPHIRAQTVHDAFFAQGFVHAQDRLWQMDYDRRRAYGRLAEVLGAGALPHDRLLRRLRLEASARADYGALRAEARAMLEAYAAGVNAFLHTARRLPIEYRLLDAAPDPWRPWDACAIFKLRHVFTAGVWQAKLWRARLLRHLGPELTAALYGGDGREEPLIVPSDGDAVETACPGLEVLQAGSAGLALMPELEGSNSWAVAGSRTATGSPLLAADPHRALEVPNVYYPNHLACPGFDAVGLSFPGVPGLPLFGHNRAVAWGVTTAMADVHDLYLERFDPRQPQRYRFRQQWRQALSSQELLRVRGGTPERLTVTATHHGPIIVGDPARGAALALRHAALAAPSPTFEAFVPMLQAASVDAFEEAMRSWVDPCNNLLMADVHGRIGYRLRGQVPLRSRANAWLPVPGWTGDHEWQGVIPFEAMPRLRDPAAGFIVAANNRIVDASYPYYLALHYEPGFRARRIRERLRALDPISRDDVIALQADRLSLAARSFVAALPPLAPPDALGAAALAQLQGWDGAMEPDSIAATVYAVWREEALRAVMEPMVGRWAPQALGGGLYGTLMPLSQLRARLLALMRDDDRRLLPAGMDWPALLSQALARAVGWLRHRLGDDPQRWQWGRLHRTAIRHPLVAFMPELASALNPPAIAMGGDGDTVQAASLTADYAVGSAAVARLVFDLSDWRRSAWAMPLGVSGHPGSPHYADQAALWGAGRLYPMFYDWDEIRAAATTVQRLAAG